MVIDLNYWTKVIRKIIIIISTILLVYLGFKLVFFYLPFLIAFAISLLLEPIIKFLMKKLKLKRKYSSIVVIIIIMAVIIGLILLGISTLISEGSNFLNNVNGYVEIASRKIELIINKVNLQKLNISETVLTAIENSSKELLDTISLWLQSNLKNIINFITSIPTMGVYIVITFLALYFICSDKIYMLDQVEHHLPEVWVKKFYRHIKDLIKVLGNYLKSQVILILISFIISLIGFYIFYFMGLNVKYPFLYAIGIAFVDALPIFGSGTIMVPWAVISATYGDIKLGIYILLLWGLMVVIRQMLEPRIVGKSIGVHPIFTLIAMYTGFRIVGVIGLFIGPIILIILKNIFENIISQGVIKSIVNINM